MDLRFDYNGTEIVLSAERVDHGWRVRLPNEQTYDIVAGAANDETVLIAAMLAPGADTTLPASKRFLRIPYVRTKGGVQFSWHGQAYRFNKSMPASARAPGKSEPVNVSGTVTTPTGGMVVDIFVEAGQVVEAFQPIAVVEAMKVMTTVEAPRPGRIEELFVTRGQRIEQGAPIGRVGDIVTEIAEPGDVT